MNKEKVQAQKGHPEGPLIGFLLTTALLEFKLLNLLTSFPLNLF
jgi:hypothetical protein